MATPTAPASRRHDERGFTLSEFALVAVVVTGLLVVAVLSIRGIRDETSTSSCQSELRTLRLRTESYQAENGVYPVDKAVLVDAGLLEEDDVEHWDLVPGAAGEAPEYEPVGDTCR